MKSHSLTGGLLIFSPLVMIVGGFLSPAGLIDWSDTAALLAAIATKPSMHGVSMVAGNFGFVLALCGLLRIRDSMSGAQGGELIKLGVLLMFLGAAGGIVEGGLHVAAAEAAALPLSAGMIAGATFLAASQGVGGVATTIGFLGFSLVGVAIMVQKNFNLMVGVLVAAVGVFGVVMAASNYVSSFMMVGYMAMMASFLVLGIVSLRSKD